MIIERHKVLTAYRRARFLGSDHETACAVVSQALGIAIEAAREAHPDKPGGSHERMATLNAAQEAALAECFQ